MANAKYYDRKGKLYRGRDANVMWALDRQIEDYFIVREQVLPNGLFVLTEWVGIDLNDGKGELGIFQTRVLLGDKPVNAGVNYSSEEKALNGHVLAVIYYSKFKSVNDLIRERKV